MQFSTSANYNFIPALPPSGQSDYYPSLEIDWVRVYKDGNPGPHTTAPPNGAVIVLRTRGPSQLVTVNQANQLVSKSDGPITNNEKFRVEYQDGGPYIALKSLKNNKYVQCNRSASPADWPLMALGNKVGRPDEVGVKTGIWERFLWLWDGGVTFGLRCDGNGLVVSADRSLNSMRPLVSNRPAIGGDWEKFVFERVG